MGSWLFAVAMGVMFLLIAASGQKGLWWSEAPTRNRRLFVVFVGIAFILVGAFWRI
jgi:uncharacterized membrane protein